MRVEFLKARARALRYKEESLLLQEEKRRVLVSLEQQAEVWEVRERKALLESTAEDQGRAMYAAKQATIRRSLRNAFFSAWYPVATDGKDSTDKDRAAKEGSRDHEGANKEGTGTGAGTGSGTRADEGDRERGAEDDHSRGDQGEGEGEGENDHSRGDQGEGEGEDEDEDEEDGDEEVLLYTGYESDESIPAEDSDLDE